MTSIERHAWRWVLFHEKAMNDVEGLDNVLTVPYVCKDARQAATRWIRELDEKQIRTILDVTTGTRAAELLPRPRRLSVPTAEFLSNIGMEPW